MESSATLVAKDVAAKAGALASKPGVFLILLDAEGVVMCSPACQKFLGRIESAFLHNPRIFFFLYEHFQLAAIDMHLVVLAVGLLVDDCAVGCGVLDDSQHSGLPPAPATLSGDLSRLEILRNPIAALASKDTAVDFTNYGRLCGVDNEITVNAVIPIRRVESLVRPQLEPKTMSQSDLGTNACGLILRYCSHHLNQKGRGDVIGSERLFLKDASDT